MMMKRNMKLLMLASLLGFVALSAQAVPAKKGVWRMVTLADGTQKRVELRGDEFCSYFVSEETQGVMVKDSVMESVDKNGAASYIGFLREKNNFDNDEEIDTDSDQIFKEKMAEYDAAAVVDFTVVE